MFQNLEKRVRTLHRLGSCYMVPGVDRFCLYGFLDAAEQVIRRGLQGLLQKVTNPSELSWHRNIFLHL